MSLHAGNDSTAAARLSPTNTFNNTEAQHDVPAISNFRRYFLLFVFSLAQFLDIFAASAVILALTDIARALNMVPGEEVWIVNAYALVLAATLLTGGRLADIWSAKWVFIGGFGFLGIMSLVLPFITNKAAFLFIRALSALGAALTIPAATNLIIHLFPEPDKQAIAIALFGGSGAIANIIGLIVGGALLIADYRWIFWFISIVSLPFAILCVFIIPKPKEAVFSVPVNGKETDGTTLITRKAKFDWGGTFFQIASIALTVYGLTSANYKGWKKAETLAPLIIGIALFPVFFLWEARMDPIDALIRPAMWRIQNFTLISIFALALAFWYFAGQVSFSIIMQEQWNPRVSAIMTAVRFLPSSIAGVIAMIVMQGIPISKLSLKPRLIGGSFLAGMAMLMLAFAGTSSYWYWRLIFPAFVIGSAGNSSAFVSAYVNFLQSVPPEVSGVAGAILQSIAQLGVAALLSIKTTIEVAYPENPVGPSLPSAKGYKYSFFFAMAVMLAETVLVIVFFKSGATTSTEELHKIESRVEHKHHNEGEQTV